MAKLTSAERSRLPAKDFAGPHRSFPLENRAHDLAAIIDVPKAVKAGHLSREEGARITAEAKRKLG
jgi:hypothetical protein